MSGAQAKVVAVNRREDVAGRFTMHLSLSVAVALRELAQPANPTPAQMDRIFDGWFRLFTRLGIEPEHQEAEFTAIMRARVQAGVISIVADEMIA